LGMLPFPCPQTTPGLAAGAMDLGVQYKRCEKPGAQGSIYRPFEMK
jgi:hypothetical protein